MTMEPNKSAPGDSEMKFKLVMRLDRRNRIYRLFRVMWIRGRVGDGKGYSVKFSVALEPRIVSVRRNAIHWPDVIVTILGVRIHYQRSYGGLHV
jgi:hypothetical protein